MCIFTIQDIVKRKRERKKYRLLSSLSLISSNLARNTQRLSWELENIQRHIEPQIPQSTGARFRFYPIPPELLAEKPSSAASTPGEAIIEAQTPGVQGIPSQIQDDVEEKEIKISPVQILEVQGIPSESQEDVKDVEVKLTPVQIPGLRESSALMQRDAEPVAQVPQPVNSVNDAGLSYVEQSSHVSIKAGQLSADDPDLVANASGKPIVAAQIPANPAQIPANPGQIPANPAQIPANPAQIPANPAQIPENPVQIQDLPSQMFEQSYYQDVMSRSSGRVVPYNRTWSRLNNMRIHRNLNKGGQTKKN